VKSNSSKVFLARKRAALIRPSPPWLSRAEPAEEDLGEALIAPLLLAGPVGDRRQRTSSRWGF
jgi:hypothetical protein